ncbi:hypothetical protein NL108_001836 [Boleophthalmus pectinirostris]|nr:hypothetical protein NL108_001836 [Boleophthalmus pectinirostris]
MERKLQFCVLVLQLQVSLAVWKHLTVIKGHTLHLSCPLKSQPDDYPAEWRNPDGVKDKRYRVQKLSESEFQIRISNVTFSDGGIYTCTHYLPQAVEKKVHITVIGRPRIEFTTHNEWLVIRCTAAANDEAPGISWQIKNGVEFQSGHPQTIREDKKYEAIETMYVKAAERTHSLKCIVQHPALHSKTLQDFVKIRPNKRKQHPKTTISAKTTPTPATIREPTAVQFPTTPKEELTSDFSTIVPQFSTGMKNTTKNTTTQQTTLPTTEEKTTEPVSTTEKQDLTSEFSRNITQFSTDADETTGFPMNTSQFNSSEFSTVESTTQRSGILNTTGNWLTVNISSNETTNNSTERDFDREKQEGKEGNAALLIFLITCLMIGLLVVVTFIGIKLRRAHLIWKRENDDTDTSEASNKSKSSQEEKNTQRRRGFFNTGLTQYVVQEPTVITSVTNPAAMTPPENMSHEQNSATQQPPQAPPKPIKETEL